MPARSLMGEDEYAVFMRQYNRTYQQENAERIKAQRALYRANNVDKIKRQQAVYRANKKQEK